MMRDAAEHPAWSAHQPHAEAALARLPDPTRYDQRGQSAVGWVDGAVQVKDQHAVCLTDGSYDLDRGERATAPA
jgi:hypothetical protein